MLTSPQRFCNPLALIASMLFAITLTGCDKSLPTGYGYSTPPWGASINGTSVLSTMFKQAGHNVRAQSSLTPSSKDVDVIVWVPDDFQGPNRATRKWFDSWLANSKQPKTLIYIGRDFDAEARYWSTIRLKAPIRQRGEIRRRTAKANSNFKTERKRLPKSQTYSDWLTIKAGNKHEKIDDLIGPWASDLDASKIEIEHTSRMVPSKRATSLLATADGEALISEIKIPENSTAASRLVIVENGSFLLNFPLVNHEHRKIAGRLIDSIGKPRKKIIFLHSYPGGPTIHDKEPESAGPPTGLALLSVWPIAGTIFHWIAFGLVFMMTRWAIFGVPKNNDQESLTDFGDHISALGRLLAQTGDTGYAQAMLANYQNATQGESKIVEPAPVEFIAEEDGK